MIHKLLLSFILLVGSSVPFLSVSQSFNIIDVVKWALAIGAVASLVGVWMGRSWGYLGGLIVSLCYLISLSAYWILIFVNAYFLGNNFDGSVSALFLLILPVPIIVYAISAVLFWRYWRKRR